MAKYSETETPDEPSDEEVGIAISILIAKAMNQEGALAALIMRNAREGRDGRDFVFEFSMSDVTEAHQIMSCAMAQGATVQ